MSLGGYGFVQQDNHILVQPVALSGQNVFNGYRQRLIQYASPTRLLSGDNQQYQLLTSEAQMTLARIVLINHLKDAFSFADFTQTLLAVTEQFGSTDSVAVQSYIETIFPPLLDSLVETGDLRLLGETYQVVQPSKLLPTAVKTYDQYTLEQQYLGAHESLDSWNEYMELISAAGLPTYQTERPLVYQTPEELKARTSGALPLHGSGSVAALLSEMATLVGTYSINQSTANFMAFPESGNSKAAVAAAMLIPLWNQNLISVDKSAPLATFVEVQVVEWLRNLVGYNCAPTLSALNIGGVTATGGVMSNTVGLLVARSLVYPEARKSGLVGSTKKPYLLIADKTLDHYSHKAGFWWLGLGEDNVIPVKANGYNFDIEDLKHKIKIYNSGDNVVVAVACLAGDSRTLTIQNIEEIYAETSKHGIWLHVDACQGGIGLFATNREELCSSYKLADSISIDPHKGLGIPYSSSFCLFKDQNILQHIAKSTDITIAKGSFDIGQITPFLGSRPFDALKFWALVKFHGLDGLAKNVDRRIALTKFWATCLNDSDSFVALNDPELTAISFSVDPRKIAIKDLDAAQISIINKKVHDRCYKAGWLVIHCFDLVDFENRLGLLETNPIRVLGTNFGNILLDKNHFPKIIAYMESQLTQILSEYTSI